MKLEVNIEKRHLYFFIGFIVLVMGVMIVVAFGTSSPSTFGHSAEEVGAGTINNTLTILQSGKVGIGTTTPTTRLEVTGVVEPGVTEGKPIVVGEIVISLTKRKSKAEKDTF